MTRLWYQSVLTYPFNPDGISTGMITVDVGRLSGVSKLGFHHATCKGYCGLGAALGQTNAGVDNATGSRTMISPLGSLGSTSTRRLSKDSKAHGIETSRVIGVRSISGAPSQAHVLPRGFTVGGGGSSKGWGACRCATWLATWMQVCGRTGAFCIVAGSRAVAWTIGFIVTFTRLGPAMGWLKKSVSGRTIGGVL